MKAKKAFTLILFSLLVTACHPLKGLYKEIRKYGYIEYKTPLQYSGTGTIIGGSPSQMELMAPPQECFPDEIDGVATNLRFYDHSSLPNKTRKLTASGNIGLDLLNIASLGGAVVGAGAKFDIVQTVALNLEGVHVEYFNAPQLTRFYLQHMDEVCKNYLDVGGFVFQAIKVDKLSYKFYNETGVEIELDLDKLKEILDIDLKLKFHIENSVELVFDDPRYIGYQLGRLRLQDSGYSLHRASKVSGNKWKWKSLNVFDDEKSLLALPYHESGLESYPDESLQIDENSDF